MNRRSISGSAARGTWDLQPRPGARGRGAPEGPPWLLIPRRGPSGAPTRSRPGHRDGADV